MFSYHISAFGCQMNLADSERISAFLKQEKGKPVADFKKADLIVFVTCGVRKAAEERAISLIKKIKKNNPKGFLILTGCLAYRKDVQKRLEDTVSFFVLPAGWGKLKGKIEKKLLLNQLNQNQAENLFLEEKIQTCFYETKPDYNCDFRAFVPIMTGCNNFCAYCVVPYARGREISRQPENILKEIKELIKRGVKEIYLLGQNVNSFKGKDKKGAIWDFSMLLTEIDALKGDFWIKFLSSHPKDISDKFIKALAKTEKVSPNLHLPIQSGSNKILKLMNRKYTREDYLKLVDKIKKNAPKTVISSDLIVGFPGETEKDFLDSLDIVKKCQFELLFSLKYSARPGTTAALMKETVSEETKKNRQKKLDSEWKKIASKINRKYLNKKLLVLIDRKKVKKNLPKGVFFLSGKTWDEKNVFFEGGLELIGKWVYVKIEKTGPLGLLGKFLEVKK